MTVFVFVDEICAGVEERRPRKSAAATFACSLRPGRTGVLASWGKLRCIWSRTFWEGAAKRRVGEGGGRRRPRVVTGIAPRVPFFLAGATRRGGCFFAVGFH